MLIMAHSVSYYVARKAQRGTMTGGWHREVHAFCPIKARQEKKLIVLATTDKKSEASEKKRPALLWAPFSDTFQTQAL